MKKLNTLFFKLILLLLTTCSKNKENKIIFKTPIFSEPSSIDAHIATDGVSTGIIKNMFSGLTMINLQTGECKPGLAESWNISKDRKTYTFYLRNGLTWSDGAPITAEGIRKSYLRALDRKTGSTYIDLVKSTIFNGQEYFDGKISEDKLGIKVIDDKTLEITLTGPKPYFLKILTIPIFIPVPIHIIEKYGKNWTNPENIVSSGAYKLKTRIANEQIVIEKNPLYFNADKVKIDEVVFLPTEGDTAYNMYLNNEIDILHRIQNDTITKVKSREDYYTAQSNIIKYIVLNLKIKPFNNLKVRQALTLAIDREKLAETVLNKAVMPTRNVSPSFKNYSYGKNLVLFDPENAKKLLLEAGYPNGKDFPKITLKYTSRLSNKKIVEFLQNQWRENLNINVDLQNEEWGALLHNQRLGNYDMLFTGWLGDYPDAIAFLATIFTNEAIGSHGFKNYEYNTLIKESDFESDSKKREKILIKAEFMIIEKHFPVIPLFFQNSHILFKNNKWNWYGPNISEIYLYEDIEPKTNQIPKNKSN